MGYGVDLNCAAEGGNTVLHLILVRKTMKSLDHNSPYTLQVIVRDIRYVGRTTSEHCEVKGVTNGRFNSAKSSLKSYTVL